MFHNAVDSLTYLAETVVYYQYIPDKEAPIDPGINPRPPNPYQKSLRLFYTSCMFIKF